MLCAFLCKLILFLTVPWPVFLSKMLVYRIIPAAPRHVPSFCRFTRTARDTAS